MERYKVTLVQVSRMINPKTWTNAYIPGVNVLIVHFSFLLVTAVNLRG